MTTNRQMQIGMVVLASMALAGCSSGLAGKRAASQVTREQASIDVLHEYAQAELDAGRQLMRSGSYASALEPLRRAAIHPATAAAAHNAMGVAYAKLGRAELAMRLFTVAVAEDPANPAYAANLLKLEEEAPVADAKQGAGTMPAMAQGASPASGQKTDAQPVRHIRVSYGTPVTAAGPGGGMVRISRYEVRIGGNPSQTPATGIRQAELRTYPVRVAMRPVDSRDATGRQLAVAIGVRPVGQD